MLSIDMSRPGIDARLQVNGTHVLYTAATAGAFVMGSKCLMLNSMAFLNFPGSKLSRTSLTTIFDLAGMIELYLWPLGINGTLGLGCLRDTLALFGLFWILINLARVSSRSA